MVLQKSTNEFASWYHLDVRFPESSTQGVTDMTQCQLLPRHIHLHTSIALGAAADLGRETRSRIPTL